MARLIATDPARGRLPVEAGGMTLTLADPGRIGWVRDGVPEAGRVEARDGVRRLWCGGGQALVLGPGDEGVDVSDGWTVLRLDGAGWRDALARLTPLDLRGFGEGRTARTVIGHMTAQITPVGDAAVEVMVMRSMTRTAVDEIAHAMRLVAERAG